MKMFPAHVIEFIKDTLDNYDAKDLGLEPILKYLEGDALEAAKQAIEYGLELVEMIKR